MCLCCKQKEPDIKLTEDHVVPLSYGGTDFVENIQPLCGSCNSKKHVKTVDYRIDGLDEVL
jgi:5-methylcytosine-specific restriction endonuclease McrA